MQYSKKIGGLLQFTGNTCLVVLALAIPPANSNAVEITSPDKSGDVGGYTSLALDSEGYPVVSYFDKTHRDLLILRCDDPVCEGIESEHIAVVDNVGMVGSHSALVLGGTDNPVVSYYDSTHGKLKVLLCADRTCEKTEVHIPDLSEGVVGMYSSLVLDSRGYPVVSYYDDTTGSLKLLRCDDAACAGDETKNIATPDSNGDVGLHTSIALDSQGYPVISYYGVDSGLKVLHCDDKKCAGDESANISTPDRGSVGWYGALKLSAAGNPIVGYYDFVAADLKTLHCDDPGCHGDQSENIVVHESVGDEGSYLSMAVDKRDRPIVSYYNATEGGLELLICATRDCKGKDIVIRKLDSTSQNVGSHTSLVLDEDGKPVVSYYDFFNGNLKVLRCKKNECAN